MNWILTNSFKGNHPYLITPNEVDKKKLKEKIRQTTEENKSQNILDSARALAMAVGRQNNK